MPTRVTLVSCVKTKRELAAAAKDLYISPLFKGMRRYAEQNADAWFILSAEHGVLRPDQVIAPYQRTLQTMPKRDRVAWAERVRRQLLELLPAGAVVVVLAGIVIGCCPIPRKPWFPSRSAHGRAAIRAAATLVEGADVR